MSFLSARGVGWEAGGRRILGPVDLELGRGECLAVVGPNGAGKTTLLRLVAGVLAPTSGRLELGGEDAGTMAPRQRARQVAYVPQVRPDRVPLTVEQTVLLGRYAHLRRFQLVPAGEDYAAVRGALRKVGLEAIAHRPVEELSGGERQSVHVAAALAQEAALVVLDEPTTHLDPRHQRRVAELVRGLLAEGRAVLTATHDLYFAALIGDRVLALKEGVPVVSGRPAEVLEPGILATIFDTPFTLARTGERPLAVPELGE